MSENAPQSDISRSLKPLSEEDARVLDALLAQPEAINHPAALPADVDRPRERAERLTGVLTLLDQLPAGDREGEDRAVEKARQAVHAARQRERFASQVQMLAGADSGGGFSARWGQIAATAAAVLVAASLLVPVLEYNRSEAKRLACFSNLQDAGVAFAAYATDHNQLLPRGHVEPGEVWWNVGQYNRPEGEAPPTVRSNAAHLYLLVRGGYLDPGDLACPENAVALQHEMTRDDLDWPNPEAVSYSYQNQYTPRPQRLKFGSAQALLADKNPLFVVRDNQVQYDPQTPRDAPSRTHGNRGQNVLTADGVVTWMARPFLQRNGQRDNYWVADGFETFTGRETPSEEGENFLVP